MTFTLHAHYGFHPWIARITGTNAQYGFAQKFIRASAREMSSSGATGDFTYEINDPGLYRIGGSKRDDALFILWNKGGKLIYAKIDKARADKIARLMDAGQQFEAARYATRPSVTAAL